MSYRHIVVGFSLLLCVLGTPPVWASQPPSPSAQQLLEQALRLVQAGRLADALPVLRQLDSPPHRDELSATWQQRLPFLLGYVYFRTGHDTKATLQFERVRGRYPAIEDHILWYLGQSLWRLDRIQAARTALQWLLAAFPQSVFRPEALFMVAEAHLRLGELQRAADLYTTYQREYPRGARHGEVHLRLGVVHRDMDKPAAALREWRHLWLEYPEDPAAALVPGLEQTLPQTFTPPAIPTEDLLRRAQRLYSLHRHREALQAFEVLRDATPHQPLLPEVMYQIGMAQYYVRQNAAAQETFRHLYEGAPHGTMAARALFMLARLHLRLEADDEFLGTVRGLLAAFPQSQQAGEIRYLLGHFHRNRGRIAEALRAFQQVADAGKGSEFADDAWWYVGWLHYSTAEYERAAHAWGKLLQAFPASAWVPDTLYWQGRALERSGRRSEARALFERLSTAYRQTYYGYLATGRLTGRAPWSWEAAAVRRSGEAVGPAVAMAELMLRGRSNPHATRGAELWAMRLFAEAAQELQTVPAEGSDGLFYQLRAAQAYHWAGEHHRAMSILRRHGSRSMLQTHGLSAADLQEMTYPLGDLQHLDVSALAGLDPLFIGALIMAESDWNPRALSRVGARGLMQLMPGTAQQVAQRLGMGLASDEHLFDPAVNLRLGVAYLSDLLQRFHGLLPLACASYNAGEDQVSKWWARRGHYDMEEFIANIPFRETRRYVQRVFVHYASYRRIYRDASG